MPPVDFPDTRTAYQMTFPCRLIGILLLLLLSLSTSEAQRPIPYPVMAPPQFEAAVRAGTRTATGQPGPNYWQQRADYSIDATLDPAARRVTGTATIRYTNNSPDTLPHLVLKLLQNLHAPGVVRNRNVEITGGMNLTGFTAAGRSFREATTTPQAGEYHIDGTVLTVALRQPLAPGSAIDLTVGWDFRIPIAGGAPRMGQDGEVFFVSYWYPHMAVYDDLYGWNTDPYMGAGEHYKGFGDFDVRITAPASFLVAATGDLLNESDVLSDGVRDRLQRARTTDGRVEVVRRQDRGSGRATRAGSGTQTWMFSAQNIRDFAFGASAAYVWDVQRVMIDREDGPATVLSHALYRPGTQSWERAAEFGAFSLRHLSELLFPYPWSHMTSVEGIIGGGMEYPMITLIGGARTDETLFSVIYHEISHMWFPMIVGTDERSFTWMDEGMTSYNTNLGVDSFFDGSAANRPAIDPWERRRQHHYYLAETGYAVEPMRHNDRFPVAHATPEVNPVQDSPRIVASYSTPVMVLRAIEGIYGRERFLEAYRTYADEWQYRHPYPWDFFNTFERVLGENLDWLWTPYLFETWNMDHGLSAVRPTANGLEVVVEDYGLAPVPSPVRVTYTDGRQEWQTVPVSVWLSGSRIATLTFPPGEVSRVEIDPEGYLPDLDPRNNVWIFSE
ncbi:M1 family metallopeptidase [soil metagenome]